MRTDERPLSPHLTIYRWPITMILSILHRMTGVALSAGFALLAAWLAAIAFDAGLLAVMTEIASGVFGRLILLGLSFAFFFHLANGVRHLIWDTGRLFEKRQADVSAWVVIVAAVALTAGYQLFLAG